jgi:biopolymer transport protein ExbD
MNDIFEKPHRRHVTELNIVPILDMLVTVIFFLLLSTSFIEFTKLTVPPSRVSTITEPLAPPPIAPKMLLVKRGESLRMILTWTGKAPGEVNEIYKAEAPEKHNSGLQELSKRVLTDFTTKFPTEKTLQLGLGSNVAYQDLVSVMDGARDLLPDIVLISYNEAEARARGTDTESAK